MYRSVVCFILVVFISACYSPAKFVDVEIDRGSCIEGDCENGIGVVKLKDGSRYAGEFKLSEPHGNGVKIWPNGDNYDGSFKFGKRHGLGRMTTQNEPMVEKLWYLDRDAVLAKRELEVEKLRLSEEAKYAQGGGGNSGFQWGKFAALAAGAGIGGIDNLGAAEQVNILTGMATDSMSNVSGVNSTQASADQIVSNSSNDFNQTNEPVGLASIQSSGNEQFSITCMGNGACAEYSLTTQADLRKFTASCPRKLPGSCPTGPACRHTTATRSVVTYSYNKSKEIAHESCLSTQGEIVQ
jgi:hypothetical protein